MLTDDHVAAPVAFDCQELREKPGREDTGVAPLAAVAQPYDVAGIAAVKVDQLRHAFTPQQRLVGHLKQQRVAGVQRFDAQMNGVALAVLRMAVDNRRKEKFLRKRHHLRILRYHHDSGQPVRRDGLQRVADQAFALPLLRQLIAAEAGAHTGGHHDAANVHTCHSCLCCSFPGSIPVFLKKCQ